MKKLKIQFWKAERVIVMQILEQEGLPERKNEGFVHIESFPWLYKTAIQLRGGHIPGNSDIVSITFNTQYELNVYLRKAVNAIIEELFASEVDLKIGEMCKVRNSESGKWEKRKLIAVLPKQYEKRFIVETKGYPTGHSSWTFARPIVKRIKPKIEECGNVVTYTWEEK